MTRTRTAIVTGAARGIGRATAERFLADGWQVALWDIDEAALAATADDLAGALPCPCDVADPDQVARAAAAVTDRFGGIDALVNNAGTATFKPLAETTLAEWSRVLDVNLTGPFMCTQAVLPAMIARGGGAIVNVTSISGLRASTLRVAYGVSKAGLAHLTRQMAAELGEHGIRVNAVAPGPVDTAMAKAVHSPAIRAAYHDAIPLNRYGREGEIAAAIAFLCSDQASYITGQILAADGGFEATGIGLPALRRRD
jgi:NAD(P)-dependent dehydrogenase (short-subunit alcohol dehydrogenase family)